MDVLKKVVRRVPAVAVVFTETDAEGFPAESEVKGACEQFDISVARDSIQQNTFDVNFCLKIALSCQLGLETFSE